MRRAADVRERGETTVNVLGVGVSAIDMRQALNTIGRWIDTGEHHYVCVTGVHGVMESQRDEMLRRIHNEAGLVTPDGMPLVWLARYAGHRDVDRVYGPDLMLACCAASVSRGDRHFFYGGAAGVAERMINRLRQRFHGLQVCGSDTPPFRPLTAAEDEHVVARINEATP